MRKGRQALGTATDIILMTHMPRPMGLRRARILQASPHRYPGSTMLKMISGLCASKARGVGIYSKVPGRKGVKTVVAHGEGFLALKLHSV